MNACRQNLVVPVLLASIVTVSISAPVGAQGPAGGAPAGISGGVPSQGISGSIPSQGVSRGVSSPGVNTGMPSPGAPPNIGRGQVQAPPPTVPTSPMTSPRMTPPPTTRPPAVAPVPPVRSLEAVAGRLLSGEVARAQADYQAVQAQTPNTVAREQTAVQWIDLLGQASRLRPDDATLQRGVEQAYGELVGSGTGEVRRLAANNLGTMLLRKGRSGEALATLLKVEKEYARQDDVAAKAAYFYNLGLAFERAGQSGQAIDKYEISASADAGFRPALSATLRNLAARGHDRDLRPRTARWIETALERHQYDLAARTLLSLFSKPDKEGYLTGGPMVGMLLRFFAAAGTPPEEFAKSWLSPLSAAARGNRALAPVIDEVGRAFLGDFPIEVGLGSSGAARRHFRALLAEPLAGARARERPRLAVLSGFLRAVGDAIRKDLSDRVEAATQSRERSISDVSVTAADRRTALLQALQRYTAAWSVNTEDFDAALAAADLLVEEARLIDEGGGLLRGLISQLFEGKGRAYIGSDWEKIFRFHTVLGSIYYRQRKWGSSGNIYSTIFQLENALRAHRELVRRSRRDRSDKVAPVPVLRTYLAEAYRETNRVPAAFQTYVAAGEEALAAGNRSLAVVARDRAVAIRSSAGSLPASALSRFQRLDRRL